MRALGLPFLKGLVRRVESGAELDELLAVIDLVAVVVGAGGSPRAALDVIVARGPAPVAEITADLLRRGRAGWGIRDVLLVWPDQVGDLYRPLAAALLSAERDGAPVGVLLAHLAAEARVVRRQRDEARARRLSVQLLFPLVVCSLPAMVLGVVVPLVLTAVRRL